MKKSKPCGSQTARSIIRTQMPTVLPASGTTGDTAVPGSWTIIPLKRTSVTGLFATRTARCRSPPQTILRDTTGLRGFGWHEARKITPLPAEPAELRVEGLYGISHFGKRPSCIWKSWSSSVSGSLHS